MYELALLPEFICFLYIRFLRGGKIYIQYIITFLSLPPSGWQCHLYSFAYWTAIKKKRGRGKVKTSPRKTLGG